MTTLQVLKALGPIDAKSVRRDSLLRWLIVYPIFLALVVRWGAPVVTPRLITRFGFDLMPFYPLLISFVLLMTAMLSGTVVGFLLLDQKDDQTLTALRTTPLSLRGYLIYRVTVPMLLSILVTIIVIPAAGLVKIGFMPLVFAAMSAAPLAPFYGLSLAALATNKVQGFALAKAMGILMILPILAYFVPSPYQWAFAVAPLYWPAKLFWLISAGNGYLTCFAIGMIYQFAIIAGLLRQLPRFAQSW